MSTVQLPQKSGAYRWYYADVAAGDFTAVFIFMVGAVFSPRYSAALRRGGRPGEHCAVNVAIYERGARWVWVLNEYRSARVAPDRRALQVGESSIRWLDDGRVQLEVRERSSPWGKPLRARLLLSPGCPEHAELTLVQGEPHFWQPLAARCQAILEVPSLGLAVSGDGYLDTNRGEEPLGGALPGWSWTRLHRPEATYVHYQPRGSADEWHVRADAHGVTAVQGVQAPVRRVRTAWGLGVPRRLAAGGRVLAGQPRLLETSPFYARLDAADSQGHAVAEVADFRRFHQPYIRWMAHFRTRTVEGAASGGFKP